MKNLYLILLAILFGFQTELFAQEDGGISIGKGTSDAHPSAVLELVSSNKGLLIPRMTTQQIREISSPAVGLMAFDTTLGSFQYWTGTKWDIITGVRFSSGATDPTLVKEGDLFYNTATGLLKIGVGGVWKESGSKKQVLQFNETTLKLLEEGKTTGSEVDLSALMQDLSLQGTKLSISGGKNSIDLKDINTDKQTLSLNGTILSITNGGSGVDFTSILSADKVTVRPGGGISSTNVQAALVELQAKIANAGGGDMVKAIYDANDNGKVDLTETVIDAAITPLKLNGISTENPGGTSYAITSNGGTGFKWTDVSTAVADANASTKGKIKLAGDLAGTADAPTVPGLVNKVEKSVTVNGHALTGNIAVTKGDIGLDKVANTTDLEKPVSTATQTALNAKANTAALGTAAALNVGTAANNVVQLDGSGKLPAIDGSLLTNLPAGGVTSVAGRNGVVTLAKGDVGLDNVDNTSDANKPISVPMQAALGLKVNISALGTAAALNVGTAATNVVQLNANGKLPAIDGSLLTNLPAAPVTSVAGQTGVVTLNKGDVGLSNVENTADADKPVSTATAIALSTKEDASNKSTATTLGNSDVLYPTQKAVKTYVDGFVASGTPDADGSTKGKIKLTGDLGGTADSPTVPGLANKVNTSVTVNGHALTGNILVTKSDVGLSNVDNTSDAGKPVSTATQTALNAKANVAELGTAATLNVGTAATNVVQLNGSGKLPAVDGSLLTNLPSAPVTSVAGQTGVVTLAGMGLGNVDNTSDANKPVSTATQTALNAKMTKATYDANSDGVVDAAATATTATNLAGGVAGGVAYQSAAGTTAVTAVGVAGQLLQSNGAGAPTWVAAPASGVTSVAGQTGVVTLAGMGLGNVDNTSDANKPVSTATQTALNAKMTKATYDANSDGVVDAAATATTATSATTAANLAGGVAGGVAYQSAAGTTAVTAVGVAGQLLQSNGAGAPTWVAAPSSGVTSVAGQTGVVTLAGIGLGNVNNTSDAAKPVSTATQTALNAKMTTATFDANTDGVVDAAATAATATTATTATNLAGGVAGGVAYQTAAGTTAVTAAGSAGQLLQSNGAGAPTWVAAPAGGGGGVSTASDGLTVSGSDVKLGGSLTNSVTIAQTDKDLNFTATTGKVNVQNLKMSGAVYANVRTHSAATNVVWTDTDYMVILTDNGIDTKLALPTPSAALTGRVLGIINHTEGVVSPVNIDGISWPSNAQNLAATAAVQFICTGSAWEIYAGR